MQIRKWSWPRFLTAAFVALLISAETASAETVVARRRLGNNAEAMTYDPVNDRAVVMDGNDVIGVALNPLDSIVLATMRTDDGGIRGSGYRKLFDVLALPVEARQPKGIGYLPSQHRYFFTTDEPGGTGTIFSTDEQGQPRPSLVLKGLATPVDFWEGIAVIPPGAPAHGGTLAVLGSRNADNNNTSHLYFVRLDGTVEQELIPQPGTALETYFCGVAYQPSHPSTLLLSDCLSGIFAMDLVTGAPVGDQPLVPIPDAGDVEGVIARNNGNVVLSGYEGRLYAYDRSLHRTPGEDRLFTVGDGQCVQYVTWNFDTNELIGSTPVAQRLVAISGDLQQTRTLFSVPVTNEVPNVLGLAYLGNGQVGISSGFPRGIDIAQLVSDQPQFPNGRSLSRVTWQTPDFPPGAAFRARGFSLLSANDPTTYVLKVDGDNLALKVVTTTGGAPDPFYRDGTVPIRLPDRPLSVATLGRGAQVFDNGSGPQIFTGAEIYKLDGTLVHRIDWRRLGLSKQADNGVWIGGNTFATVDGLTSTVVIYSVP